MSTRSPLAIAAISALGLVLAWLLVDSRSGPAVAPGPTETPNADWDAVAHILSGSSSSPGAVIDARHDGPVFCRVHKQKLVPANVLVQYGYAGMESDEYEASERSFPHAMDVYYGGCIVSDTSPETADVDFCPGCQQARQKWLEERRQRGTSGGQPLPPGN